MRVRIVVALLLMSLTLPAFPCEKCITGLDNQTYCKDALVYDIADGQLYSECRPLKVCYRLPGAGTYCYSTCDGELCFIA